MLTRPEYGQNENEAGGTQYSLACNIRHSSRHKLIFSL